MQRSGEEGVSDPVHPRGRRLNCLFATSVIPLLKTLMLATYHPEVALWTLRSYPHQTVLWLSLPMLQNLEIPMDEIMES